jgi:sugar lactone lactonase YvrE
MVGDDTNSVHQYTLSTSFNLSTASYDSVSFSFSSQGAVPQGIAFNNDGTKMYMVESSNDSVHQYNLSTAFDVSTAAYDNVSFSVASQDTLPSSIVFNNDGTKMYMAGTGNSIYEYSTATPATITYPSTLQWPSGTAPTSPSIGETDVLTFNTTDGGTTYQAVQAIDGAK